MSNTNLAILGGGNMGRALLGGLLRCGVRPEQIRVGERMEAARACLSQDFGITATPDNLEAIEAATLIVLAVKPQDAAAVLHPLAGLLRQQRPIVLSVAAGLRIATLERWCGAGVPLVRAMPNRPALVGAGASGIYAPEHIGATQRRTVEQVLRSVGEVVWVPTEDALDVVTALSGSGPAYLFLVAELMAQAAASMGLDAQAARRLAVTTLHGSGLLAFSSDGDLVRLRAEVTSRRGTTEAALAALDAAGLPGIIASALEAAAARSRELGAQLDSQP
jgi:pyrroline-5-carboxylate reductase